LDEILKSRAVLIQKGKVAKGTVVYWMSRDQRADDNWALEFACQLAKDNNASLAVVFCLVPDFLSATLRQYGFMLKGLKEVAQKLKENNIPFYLLQGSPGDEIPKFLQQYNVRFLVTDFDPLRIKRIWKKEVFAKTDATLYTVDAHNIVPAFLASTKLEYGAYTIRPKINKLLPTYLNKFQNFRDVKQYREFENISYNWEGIFANLTVDRSVSEITWCLPGETAAKEAFDDFMETRLTKYATHRNDPNGNGVSNLSAYLHFGQLSAQRVALSVLKDYPDHPSTASFLEELIIRKELSDNFCLYNANYDSVEGFPDWAKKSLDEHRNDEREYIYSLEQFELGSTHDTLWNAAQFQMVNHGKMHGYLRMYWAKKILEWTPSPKLALQTAIYLNDKYQLDGRDPNGYAGCAWSIGGVHDRAWNKHPVYGKVRYMNYNGCKRKFDVDKYIKANST
jgi:deoxyribodipyrimidine photo-lyase